MRKGILLIIFTLLVANTLFAQIFRFGVPNLEDYDMQRFHYGFSLGVDMVDVNLKTKSNYTSISPDYEIKEIYSKPVPAFNVGIIVNMRMGKYFDLRFIPGFSIAHCINLYYRFANPVMDPNSRKNDTASLILRQIECHFINFPLLVKFKSSRMHNVRFFALAGGQIGIDMTSSKNTIPSVQYEGQVNVKPLLKNFDIQTVGGLGFDFYTTYFKLTTEFKVSLGVINMMKDIGNIKQDNIDYYQTSPIYQGLQSIKSKIFTISIIFE